MEPNWTAKMRADVTQCFDFVIFFENEHIVIFDPAGELAVRL